MPVIARVQSCILALSFSRRFAPDKKQKIINEAAAAIAGFGNREISVATINETTTILSNYPSEKIAQKGDQWLFLHSKMALTTDGRLLDANALLSEVAESGARQLDELEPPFVAIAGTKDAASAHSDFLGLGQVFSYQGSGCAAVGTSASAIARTFARPLDQFGLFQQMTIGHLLDNTTMFEDVTMVPAGSSAHLKDGTLSVQENHDHSAPPQSLRIEDGVDLVRKSVERCVNALPDAGMELSGGLDSRVVLSAIPEQLRAGRHAVTIGYPGSPDIESAKKIAGICDLSHEIVDLTQFNGESTETVWNRSRRVAYRDDFSTNIYDRLTIDCVDDFLLETSRIGGVNGEFARGFYYAAMPVEKPVTQESINRLLTWRLTTNDAAPEAVFNRDKKEAFHVQLGELVTRLVAGHQETLGSALDRFYLNQRMRRWAGSAISRAMTDRVVLTPFFHTDYIKWTRGISASSKKDSVALCQVLQGLDKSLANIPLDSGLLPAAIASGGFAMKFARFRQKVTKLEKKLLQRFGGSRKLNLGGKNFQQKLSSKDLIERLDWSAIGDIDLFDKRTIEQLKSSDISGSRTTVGYFLPLNFQLEYFDQNDVEPNITHIASH